MPNLVNCPSCGRQLRVADDLAGQAVRCPSCGATFDPPAAALGPSPVQAAPSPASPASPVQAPPGEPTAADLEPCPACGVLIDYTLTRCPACNAELEYEREQPWKRRRGIRRDQESHRSGLILTLGIISIVIAPLSLCCSVFGIVFQLGGLVMGLCSWIMGRADLAKMKTGMMDPNGYNSTHSGFVCGIIGTFMNVGVLLLMLLVIAFYGMMLNQLFRMPMPGPVVVNVATVPAKEDREELPMPAVEEVAKEPREALPPPAVEPARP